MAIVEMLICRVEYKRPIAWQHPDSTEGQWPHDEEGRALAYSEAERGEIARELEGAHIPSTIFPEDQPDPELLARLQGRVSSRGAALAALESGEIPVILEDISDIDARLKEVEARPIAVSRTPTEG